jgi:hypothetical protein
MNRGWFLALAASASLYAGCASTVTIESKGTKRPDAPIPPHVTYAIFPVAEVEKDPAFAGYSRLVAEEMNQRGYKETEPRVAQLGVYLDYAVTKAAAGPAAAGAPPPPMGGSGGMGAGGMGPGAGGYSGGGGGGTGYAGTTSSTDPSMAPRVVSQMAIIIGDLPKSRAAGKLEELWRGESLHTGSSDELPRLAPLLVDGAFRHFGESTEGKVQHTFSEEEVKKLQTPK